MYEIVNVQYTGTYNNGGTSIPAVLGEFRASSAADLPTQNVDCHIICGCDGLDIATGDKYIWNGTAWILQPSDRAFSNVYTKPEIDSMTTEIYGIIAYYHTTIVSDTGEITFYALAGYIGTWKIYGNGQQTGTPAPDNPVMPDFCGTLDGTDWKIPLTCAGQTTPVYLGHVSTVRRVKKLVVTGNENWAWRSGEPSNVYFCSNAELGISSIAGYGLSNAYRYTKGTGFNTLEDKAFIIRTNNLGIRDTRFSLLADFIAYLASQYAAGTPVTVWYVLAEPETSIVNEPLAKIGDYADELHSEDAGVSIPTAKGQNTLTVGTILKPSLIEISGGYHA